MIKTLGKGVVSGLLLVIATVVLLPMMFKLMENKTQASAEGEVFVSFQDLLRVEEEGKRLVDVDSFFGLKIPKIEASSEIISNVDASNKQEYIEALGRGIAHVKGTYFPGSGGSTTVFAHSTGDPARTGQAAFYRLDELKRGDEIEVWYMGEKYVYKVYRTWVAPRDDVGVFKRIKNGDRLFLVTCTPRGTTEKRLIVEAKLLTEGV
ncbi:sortase [Patescibacteria group bacterium]